MLNDFEFRVAWKRWQLRGQSVGSLRNDSGLITTDLIRGIHSFNFVLEIQTTTPDWMKLLVHLKLFLETELTFENTCRIERKDFWQPLPRLWRGYTQQGNTSNSGSIM